MASLVESSSSGSSSDDEVFVSVPRVAYGRHRHRRHHHHRREHGHHGHHREHAGEGSRRANAPGEGLASVHLDDHRWHRDDSDQRHHGRNQNLDQEEIEGVDNHRDGREGSKFCRQKNRVLRRLGRRAGRWKEEMLFRRLLRRHESPDQPGLSRCEDLEVQGRDGFPFHLVENWQDMIIEREKERKSTPFFDEIERVMLEELLAARPQLQRPLNRRHGRRHNHRRHHHRRPSRRQHHRNCPCRSDDLRMAPFEVCLWQRMTRHRANRFESGPEARAAASRSQNRDEVGPLSAYEEMLAQCLLDIPEAGPSVTHEEKLAERMSVDNEAGPSATYEQKLAERLMENPEVEPSEDNME